MSQNNSVHLWPRRWVSYYLSLTKYDGLLGQHTMTNNHKEYFYIFRTKNFNLQTWTFQRKIQNNQSRIKIEFQLLYEQEILKMSLDYALGALQNQNICSNMIINFLKVYLQGVIIQISDNIRNISIVLIKFSCLKSELNADYDLNQLRKSLVWQKTQLTN